MNLGTIIETLSWYKTWPLNGYNLIRAKRKLRKRQRKNPRKYLEPSQKPKVIYTDNPLEVGKSFEELSRNHRKSQPHRSETNGIAERAIRRVKEGTSSVLLQSGLDERWWSDSMECYCDLRNVQDLPANGKTPHERRFGESFKGPIVPFGALVEYLLISARCQARIHQFGERVLTWIFLGYALIAGNLERRYSDC